MESLISVLNFEEGEVKDINSPRSLEACLRAGLDPADLLPKPKSTFYSTKLTESMVYEKYQVFERRRKEKIETVKNEREAIIAYGERLQKLSMQRSTTSSTPKLTGTMEKATSTALEMEAKRLDAVRRRQEKELGKMIVREQALVDLQVKIKRAEDEEAKRKKEHEKKVMELKAIADKKKAKRAQELAEKEQEELNKRKQLSKKEAAFERKRKQAEIAALKQLADDAKQRDIERQEKLEEHRRKTEMIMEAQFSVAEQNRMKIAEREAYVKAQIESKKEQKKEELLTMREISVKRMREALEKHHQLHEKKKSAFITSQQAAAQRAKELDAIEREKFKKTADARERKNRQRFDRLCEAARSRQDYREDVMTKIIEKDKIFEKIRGERDAELKRHNFMNDLKLQELRENVERVNRIKEFARLQTLRKIQSEDEKTERLLLEKLEMQRRHREESKQSLVRKHAITNAMDIMRVTNDFSMLDQLFSGKKGRHGRKRADDNDMEDNRLSQTA